MKLFKKLDDENKESEDIIFKLNCNKEEIKKTLIKKTPANSKFALFIFECKLQK